MLSSVLPPSLSAAAKYAAQAQQGPSSKVPMQPQYAPQQQQQQPTGRFSVRVFKAPLFGYTHSQQQQQQQNWYPGPSPYDPKRFPPAPAEAPKPPLRVISNTTSLTPYDPARPRASGSYAIYPSSSGTYIYEQSICSKSDLYSNTDASTSTLNLTMDGDGEGGAGFFSPTDSTLTLRSEGAGTPTDEEPRGNGTVNSFSNSSSQNRPPSAPGAPLRFPSTSTSLPIPIPPHPQTPTAYLHLTPASASEAEIDAREAVARVNADYNAASTGSYYSGEGGGSRGASPAGGRSQAQAQQQNVYFPTTASGNGASQFQYAPGPPPPLPPTRRLSAESQEFVPAPVFNGGVVREPNRQQQQEPPLQRRPSQNTPPRYPDLPAPVAPPSNVSGHGGYTTPSISLSLSRSDSSYSSSTSGPPSVLRQQSSGPRPEVGGPRTVGDTVRRQEELAEARERDRASSPQGDYFMYDPQRVASTSPVLIPERPRRDSRTPAPASSPDRRPSYQVPSSSVVLSSSPTSYVSPPAPPAERQRRMSTSAGYAPRPPADIPLPSQSRGPSQQQTSPAAERRRSNEYNDVPRQRGTSQSPTSQQGVGFSEPERDRDRERVRVLSNPTQPQHLPSSMYQRQQQDSSLPPQPAVQFQFSERPPFPSSTLSGSRFPTSHPPELIPFPDSHARSAPPEPQRRHSDSDRSSIPLSQAVPVPPEPQRRYSDGDQMLPPRPGSSGRNAGPLGRCVRWNDNLICPSPIFPCNRRKGWFNRRGDQLWTNDGAYKPAGSGQQYPPDLDEYPEYGSGWMNEEGIRIDMGHRLIPKAPLRSALKQSKVSI